MKNAFVGHSYHKVTLSSKWFTDILQKDGSTNSFWDETWIGKRPIKVDEVLDFDRIFVWQVHYLAQQIAAIAPEKLVYLPMWDGVSQLDHEFWEVFGSTKILSFSWTLHRKLRLWGLNSFQIQFFPDPNEHQQVSDFSTKRGYLWQRRPEIGWPQVAALSGDLHWDKFLLHAGMDPPLGEFTPPKISQILEHNIKVTRFNADAAAARRIVEEANIYFAPRLMEGIGMTFLEAMARGQCVVAPEAPTMSEYITNGVNGLLYNYCNLHPVNFDRAAEVGAAARRHVEHGYEDWIHDRHNRLPDILFAGPSGASPPRTAAQAKWRHCPREFRKGWKSAFPKVTVAVVTLNAAESFDATLASVLDQTFKDVDIVVIDGESQDGTVGRILDYSKYIHTFISERDDGPYDAMNKAARLGRGEFIIYMNAGDLFACPDAVERALHVATPEIDFIIGHHIYLIPGGCEELHKAADFNETWERLRAGQVDFQWLSGVPCHQATFTRRNILVDEGGYSKFFKFAADHEFMYRMRQKGARFRHCGETIAIYAGNGLSRQNEIECAKEWWRICRAYGEQKGVDRFFRSNFPPTCEIDSHRLTTSLRSVHHSFMQLARRAIAWRLFLSQRQSR
ncbi:MAG TPA: glycosyltransferase [Aestuariivirgaceae bacterium]|jgi:GT2 family glycosyltransferase